MNDSYQDANGVVRYKQGSHVLGFKTNGDLPTKSAAQKKWAADCDEVLSRAQAAAAGKKLDHTFQSFLNEEFIPLRRSGWNKATRAKLSYYFNLMCEDFGLVLLADLDRKRMQKFLDGLADRLCHDTVSGCYTYLRAVLAEAVDQKLIDENPTKFLALPHTREKDTYTVALNDVRRLEDALQETDRIIFRLLSRCGPRAGETFAFQWQDLLPDQTLHIQRTYSRGELKPPKTRKSKKPIYLPRALYADLLQLKELAPDSAPTGWIFPAERKRRRRLASGELEETARLMPVDYHNWMNRRLMPVAKALGIRVNCQIMRRTFATLANDVGGDLKDIQAQMRHSKSATTADIYVQPIPRSVRESMEALDRTLSERPEEGQRKPKSARNVEPVPRCDIAAISARTSVLSPLRRSKPSTTSTS